MFRRGLLTLIVIAVVVAAALLGQQRMSRENEDAQLAQTPEPGYAARDAELTETGPDGRPLYRLNAQVIRQRPEDGTVQLEQVHMSYRGENSNQWALTADRGTILQNNEQIDLTGNVKVVGVLPGGTTELAQIQSEHLAFDTRTEIVTTRDPVKLLWGAREVNGTGLRANLKDRQVRLESGVHGSYAPH